MIQLEIYYFKLKLIFLMLVNIFFFLRRHKFCFFIPRRPEILKTQMR